MKLIKYIIPVIATLLLVSCFEDKSTYATKSISHITIESGIDSVYNINKNEPLIISPVISQTIPGTKLNYTWEIDQKEYSYESTFSYVGNKLGKFSCRLIVENEHGKAFFPFMLYVNSPYEEGITILSKDKDGKPMLSFMQTPMNDDEEAKFMDEDCFSKNNKGMAFALNPTDLVQTTGSIIISCKGDENEPAAVYFLNDKTFVVENYIIATEYEEFKPTKLLIPSESVVGITYPVLSENGKVYDLPTYDAILQPSTKFFSTYSQACFLVGESGSYIDILMWDKDKKGMSLLYNGYGPFYFGSKYLMPYEDADYDKANYFKGVQEFITMAYIHRTKEQMGKSDREMLVLAISDDIVQKLVIATFPWTSVENKPGEYKIMDNGGFKLAGTKAPLNENTPCIANKTYLSLLFADGNKVRRWYYTKTSHINKAETMLTVGSDEAISTGFDISDDHLKTYVTFYEPEQEGKNGSVWVFDTDTGKILEKYDNVCYQPVKMIYKKK